MHSIVSCAAWKAGSAKQAGLVATSGRSRISDINQPVFGARLDRVAAPGELDVEPPGKQSFEPIEIVPRGLRLPVRQQARERALARPGQRDQPRRARAQHIERDMRLLVRRPIEMRGGNQRAEIAPARLVLRVEREPVDDRRAHALRLERHRAGPGDAKQSRHDRLDASLLRRLRKRHRRIEPVAVGDRGGGKAEAARMTDDRLGIDRAFQHRIGREDAERHERRDHRPF